ncbi:hypothetical protein [Arthrobacter sp. efr-133-TYG-104]|nr:hypothetical protein [Arthrobacter sp. efr-133-TYG-104]
MTTLQGVATEDLAAAHRATLERLGADGAPLTRTSPVSPASTWHFEGNDG